MSIGLKKKNTVLVNTKKVVEKSSSCNVLQTNKNKENNKNDKHLSCNWILWAHSLISDDWTLKGYRKLYTIKTVGEFWSIYNNLDKLGLDCYHIYLMKDGIPPMWEDSHNRGGGICSIKIDFKEALPVYEQICSYTVTENLTDCFEDINGVSFSPKINSRLSFAIIKIWNSDSKKNVSKCINEELYDQLQKYNFQYKSNVPEY